MENEDIKKELIELSKTLAAIPKSNRDNAPVGYFDKLPDLTWEKLASTKSKTSQPKARVLPLFSKLAGVAASITLLFFVFKNVSLNQAKDDVPLDAVVEFIIDDLGELDEEFLFEIHTQSLDLAEINDEALDYILEEEIDMIDDQILETLY